MCVPLKLIIRIGECVICSFTDYRHWQRGKGEREETSQYYEQVDTNLCAFQTPQDSMNPISSVEKKNRLENDRLRQ